jgi:hypothetical protein
MVTKNTPVNRPSEILCGSGEELSTDDAVWRGDEIIHTRCMSPPPELSVGEIQNRLNGFLD